MSYFSARFAESTSPPATLAGYLQSINKANFYGIYLPSYGLAPLFDGTGGTVALNGAVGYWAASEQVAFNHKWIQDVTGSRPAYVLTDGSASVIGNSVSASLYLSNAALDGVSYTVLVSYKLAQDTGYLWSQSATGNAFQMQSQSYPRVRTTGLGFNAPQAWTHKPGATEPTIRGGWTGTTTTTGAPRLFAASTNSAWSGVAIKALAVVPALNESQIMVASGYLPW